MKKIILSLGLSLFVINTQSQNKINHCGIENIIKKTGLSINQKINENFQKTPSVSATQSTVNVVFHVVWRTPEENLSDSIIYKQMEQLNQCFNKQNVDTGNLRPIFKPIAGNSNIYFNLHQIVRKHTDSIIYTSSTTSSPTDTYENYIGLKHDSLGGSSAIDPSHFLNVWSAGFYFKISLNIPTLGDTVYYAPQFKNWAYPPSGLPNWPNSYQEPSPNSSGVCVSYLAIGGKETQSVFGMQLEGKTLVHEVGHYLGLRHNAGDAQGNCSISDDGIADTPKQAWATDSCDFSKNGCLDTTLPWTTLDSPDMIENFMEYTQESCRNAFTQGQTDFMCQVLTTKRVDLISNSVGVTEEPNQNIHVKLYPNPAKDNLQIELLNFSKNTEIAIYNLLGELMFTKSINHETELLDMNNLETGVYFIEITNNKNKYYREKIIIEKNK